MCTHKHNYIYSDQHKSVNAVENMHSDKDTVRKWGKNTRTQQKLGNRVV